MFLSVRANHNPEMKLRAMNSVVVVVDMDTMEKIDFCIWANEEKGRYRRYATDPNGKILRKSNRISADVETVVCKGNIKIMTVEEFEALKQ